MVRTDCLAASAARFSERFSALLCAAKSFYAVYSKAFDEIASYEVAAVENNEDVEEDPAGFRRVRCHALIAAIAAISDPAFFVSCAASVWLCFDSLGACAALLSVLVQLHQQAHF